jgi:hypothetical protein
MYLYMYIVVVLYWTCYITWSIDFIVTQSISSGLYDLYLDLLDFEINEWMISYLDLVQLWTFHYLHHYGRVQWVSTDMWNAEWVSLDIKSVKMTSVELVLIKWLETSGISRKSLQRSGALIEYLSRSRVLSVCIDRWWVLGKCVKRLDELGECFGECFDMQVQTGTVKVIHNLWNYYHQWGCKVWPKEKKNILRRGLIQGIII